jgi:hypothetical protein
MGLAPHHLHFRALAVELEVAWLLPLEVVVVELAPKSF